jgi:hypothetical protein
MAVLFILICNYKSVWISFLIPSFFSAQLVTYLTMKCYMVIYLLIKKLHVLFLPFSHPSSYIIQICVIINSPFSFQLVNCIFAILWSLHSTWLPTITCKKVREPLVKTNSIMAQLLRWWPLKEYLPLFPHFIINGGSFWIFTNHLHEP